MGKAEEENCLIAEWELIKRMSSLRPILTDGIDGRSLSMITNIFHIVGARAIIAEELLRATHIDEVTRLRDYLNYHNDLLKQIIVLP